MAKIYTRRGDDGTTGIYGGERVPKEDPRIEANGSVDELNCQLGVVRSLLAADDSRQAVLERIQRALMSAMSLVATPSGRRHENPRKFDADLVPWCEEMLDALSARLSDVHHFVLPGGTPVAAHLQLARAVARRAERRLWTLHRTDPLPEVFLTFVNRLSDLLFVMARTEMQQAGADEELWQRFGKKQRTE